MPELDPNQTIPQLGVYSGTSPFGGTDFPTEIIPNIVLSAAIERARTRPAITGFIIPKDSADTVTKQRPSDTTIYFGILVGPNYSALQNPAHSGTRQWMNSFKTPFAVQTRKNNIIEPLEPGDIVVHPRTGKGFLIGEGRNIQPINLLAPSA